jgi:hypothetical protein
MSFSNFPFLKQQIKISDSNLYIWHQNVFLITSIHLNLIFDLDFFFLFNIEKKNLSTNKTYKKLIKKNRNLNINNIIKNENLKRNSKK